MNDTIQLEAGGVPWQPSSDAELVETFVYYNMPIVGIIRQRGINYLFRCAEGFGDVVHVWAYVAISDRDLSQLRQTFQTYGKDKLWDTIESIVGGGKGELVTVVLATDDDGVLLAMTLKPEKDLSIIDSDALVEQILWYGRNVADPGSKEDRAVSALYKTVFK